MAKLRVKTTEKLPEEMQRILKEQLEEFLQEKEEAAEGVIWMLSYDPKPVLIWMGFPEDISDEEIKVIQSELASQYRTVHKDCEYGQTFEGKDVAKTKAARELRAALGEDPFAFDSVMQKLIEKSYALEFSIDKTLRCLESKKDTSKFGGIKSLGFGKIEANFLIKAANQMGKVLEELTKEKMSEYRARQEEIQRSGDLPFYFGEEEKPREESDEEEEDAEEMLCETQNEGLSPMELIQNRKKIEDFFKALELISQDPNAEWLSEHEEEVKEFFNQCDKFK